MTTLRFVILCLACYRLALMLSKEDGPGWLFTRIRSLVKRKAPKETALKKGISCEWCVSVWFGIILSVAESSCASNRIYETLILALALSSAAVIINQQFTKG